MTLEQFNNLPYNQQLATVYEAGQFLATRWQEEHEAVNLYELPGHFFAELTYDTAANEIHDLRSFGRHDYDRLEDYAGAVNLPRWLPEVE